MNDSEKMFVTKENAPEIRRILRKEISNLTIKYFIVGFAFGVSVGYILYLIEGLLK